MINLKGGRLILEWSREAQKWEAQIILGDKENQRLKVMLEVHTIQDAMVVGTRLFNAWAGKVRPPDARPICCDCVQYVVGTRDCALGFPECRRTGGRYAGNCELFQRFYSH